MQVEFQPLGMIGRGYCSVSRSSPLEARHVGSNASSSSHEVDAFAGFEHKATPSEGAKRRYRAHFVSKLTDADGENGETDTWIDFASSCGYLDGKKKKELSGLSAEVGAMLGSMVNRPDPFLISPDS